MKNDLGKLREEINKIDKEILALLKKRLGISGKVGKIKSKLGLKIIDKKREGEIINKAIASSGLESNFIKNLYKLIFNYSYKIQKKYVKKY